MLSVQRLSLIIYIVALSFASGCTTINVNDVPAVVEEVGNIIQKICLIDRNPVNPECLIVTEKQPRGEAFIGRIDARAERLFAVGKSVVLLTVEKKSYLCTSPVFYCFAVERR